MWRVDRIRRQGARTSGDPPTDRFDLAAACEQVDRRGVPEDMRRDASPTLPWVGVKARRVSADDLVNAEAGQRFAVLRSEDRGLGLNRALRLDETPQLAGR